MIKQVSLLLIGMMFFTFMTLKGNTTSYSHSTHSYTNSVGIRINGGAPYTNNPVVEVEVKPLNTNASLIEFMQIDTSPDLTDVEWQPYSTKKISIELKGNDGTKKVYARLRDKAGNISSTVSAEIILDTKPPENCKIFINNGEVKTNDNLGRVLITPEAEDAQLIMLSNSVDFSNSKWEPVKPAIKWILDISSGDGKKVVFAKFLDLARNESHPVEASIILDTSPPDKGRILINDGAKYTKSKKILIKVSSDDAKMVRIISRGKGQNFDYEPDNTGFMTIPWEIDTIQGNKIIKAYFMDEAKNKTLSPIEASIIYKTRPPSPAIVTIDQGNKYTNHPKGIVEVSIVAREDPQSLSMIVSDKPDFKGAEKTKFQTSLINYQLDSKEDGLKTVYVRLIDEAGNVSDMSKGEIFLDRTPPTINSFNIMDGAEWSISEKVSLHFDVTDGFQTQISNNPEVISKVKWEKYIPVRTDWSLTIGDGKKIVYARFRDEAGNISEATSASILLDTKPPEGDIMLNKGSRYTNNPNGQVTVYLKYEEDVIGMQLTNQPDFTDVKLLPVQSTIENYQLDVSDDGPKTVFMRLRDKAGNFSKVYTAGIFLDRTVPAEAEMTINNNSEWVNNRNNRVSLNFKAEGAQFMMISNEESFKDVEWSPFRVAVPWNLGEGEGTHTVYAKFKDVAGNESAVISGSIKSDYTPPAINKILLNDGDQYCNDPQKKINLSMDVEGAHFMIISNNSLRDSSLTGAVWEPFNKSKDWILSGEDELKTIYFAFRDLAGNTTREHTEKIMLDRVPPSEGKISVNQNAKWYTDKSGSGLIQLHAVDAHEMMISDNSSFTGAKWEPFMPTKEDWVFNPKGDKLIVYAKFRDRAGNVSEAVEYSMNVDLSPPDNCSIILNNRETYLKNPERKVTIRLNANDAYEMRISPFDHFRDASWEPFVKTKEIIVPESDGAKNFFVQFRDEAGNESEVVSSTIFLDTTPPQLGGILIDGGEKFTNSKDKKVRIEIKASDASEMMISNDPDFAGSSWQPFNTSIENYILPGDDGEKTIFIKLRDEAGNVSTPGSATINLKRSF